MHSADVFSRSKMIVFYAFPVFCNWPFDHFRFLSLSSKSMLSIGQICRKTFVKNKMFKMGVGLLCLLNNGRKIRGERLRIRGEGGTNAFLNGRLLDCSIAGNIPRPRGQDAGPPRMMGERGRGRGLGCGGGSSPMVGKRATGALARGREAQGASGLWCGCPDNTWGPAGADVSDGNGGPRNDALCGLSGNSANKHSQQLLSR